MHSDRASAKVPSGRRASRNPLFTSDASACRAGASARPCRWRKPGRPVAGRRQAASGRLGRGRHMSQPRMYYGCTRRTRKEDTCRRRCTRAPHGQHRQAPAPAARLRYGFAAVCAALAPLLCPAPAQAGDDYDALILRARAGDHQPALAMLRALSGRRPARHPGPHPGGQLGGPARRGDAGLRATARRRAAARRRSVGGGARCATCAAGRKRWRSSATACAPIRPSPPSPPASP